MAFIVQNHTGFKIYVILEKLETTKYKLHISQKPIELKQAHIIYSCHLLPNQALNIGNEELEPESTAKIAIHDFESALLTRSCDKNENIIIKVYIKN